MAEARVLVYDYAEGYVVDARTGEVVDRIYDYSPPRGDQRPEVAKDRFAGRRPGERLKRLYEAYRRFVYLEERGFVVEFEKLLSCERRVKTLKHERSIRAERYFAELGLLDTLAKIVEELDAKGYTSGMTLRGRLVLAYVLYKLSRGETPRYSELRGVVSESTFRKIKARARVLAPKTGR